jgi:hypothetical protein
LFSFAKTAVMSQQSFDDVTDQDLLLESTLKSGKLHNLTKKTKARSKKLLNLDQSGDHNENLSPAETARNDLKNSPAFNPSRFLHQPESTVVGVVEKVVDVLQGTAQTLVHPKKAAQSHITKTAAGKLAKGRPHLSKQVDIEFLDAHGDLEDAQSSACVSNDEETTARKEKKVDDCNGLVRELDEKRLSMRVAWITDRHLRRVKVLEPKPGRFPDDKFFEAKDEYGETEYQWGKWVAHVSNMLAYE